MQHIELLHGDCLEVLKQGPDNSVDLVVTSPPYDNLRTYNNSLAWDFEGIAKELYRVIKPGGVIVWVVADGTTNGSETGTSFKQALYFKSLGLNLHDTMIYASEKPPLTHNRYEQKFEYMFVFSKGKPKTFNPILDKSKHAGATASKRTFRHDGENLEPLHNTSAVVKDYKIRGNIWTYSTGGKNLGHPAVYPLQLAQDHINSWSNPGDLVMDPFMGSATTGIAAIQTGRSFIGIEKEPNYFAISQKRIAEAQSAIPAQESLNTNNTKVVNE